MELGLQVESLMPELGRYLRTLRESRGWTLRELEAATTLSNPYLSQLENGRIKRPSPKVIHRLAEAFGVAYEELMQRAGYLPPSKAKPRRGKSTTPQRASALTNLRLTAEEEDALVEYLAFLRYRHRRQ